MNTKSIGLAAIFTLTSLSAPVIQSMNASNAFAAQPNYKPYAPTEDTVDRVEINYVLTRAGACNFKQFIFYDYDCRIRKDKPTPHDKQLFKPTHGYTIVDWRFIHDDNDIPDPTSSCFDEPISFYFKDGDIVRKITTKKIVLTHTTGDPEMAARKNFPDEFRRKLTPPIDFPVKKYHSNPTPNR